MWFNMFNEPQGGSSDGDIANWLTLQRRAPPPGIAPNNIFVADIGYGQAVETFTGSTRSRRLGAGQCNILYSGMPAARKGQGLRRVRRLRQRATNASTIARRCST
jgi:hypothetical protein